MSLHTLIITPLQSLHHSLFLFCNVTSLKSQKSVEVELPENKIKERI